MSVGFVTLLRSDHQAQPQHVAAAVQALMAQQRISLPQTILLYVTEQYQPWLKQMLLAVKQVSHCFNIFGGVAHGVLTENAWVFDRPTIALMLIGEQSAADDCSEEQKSEPFVASPLAANSIHLSHFAARLPEIASFGVQLNQGYWRQGQLQRPQSAEWSLPVRHAETMFIAPWQIVGTAQEVRDVDKLRISRLGADRPGVSLARACQDAKLMRTPNMQFSLIKFDGSASESALMSGNYHEILLLSADDDSVNTSTPQAVGDQLYWAYRSADAARQALNKHFARLRAQHATPPTAGFYFASLACGPSFYGCEDPFSPMWRATFPNTPLIGAYGEALSANHPAQLHYHGAQCLLVWA